MNTKLTVFEASESHGRVPWTPPFTGVKSLRSVFAYSLHRLCTFVCQGLAAHMEGGDLSAEVTITVHYCVTPANHLY